MAEFWSHSYRIDCSDGHTRHDLKKKNPGGDSLCNPNTWEAKLKKHHESEASLGYTVSSRTAGYRVRPRFKNKTKLYT